MTEPPLRRLASVWLGGRLGQRVRRLPWSFVGRWSPLAVLLLVTTVVFALGVVQKGPCYDTAWQRDTGGQDQTSVNFTGLCYSDVALLYRERGFADGQLAYFGDQPEALEYPVLTGATMQVTAWVTQLFGDGDPLEESRLFFGLTALVLFLAALVTIWLLYRARLPRPYDALMVALAPSLALTATINWDLLAVALSVGSLLAWSRSRPVLAGVLLGLGIATKLYPLFLLGAFLVLAIRAGRMPQWFALFWSTLLGWGVVNLPVMLTRFDAWATFWTFNEGRGADFGSIWYALGMPQNTENPVNGLSLAGFVLACSVVAGLALLAPRRPRLGQLAFLVVAGFLLVNKVYSPQYVLWLLPLVVLARPNWRDWMIWQGAELVYWLAIWWHLGGVSGYGGNDPFYLLAVCVRLLGTAYLCGQVIADIVRPERDPWRADGRDDPLGGPLDGAPDPEWWVRNLGGQRRVERPRRPAHRGTPYADAEATR